MRNARDKSTPTIAQPDAGAEPGDLKAPAVASAAAQDRALSTRQLAWRRFKRHKLAMISAFRFLLLMKAPRIASSFPTPATSVPTVTMGVMLPFSHR